MGGDKGRVIGGGQSQVKSLVVRTGLDAEGEAWERRDGRGDRGVGAHRGTAVDVRSRRVAGQVAEGDFDGHQITGHGYDRAARTLGTGPEVSASSGL